jgi:hypothetical protein
MKAMPRALSAAIRLEMRASAGMRLEFWLRSIRYQRLARDARIRTTTAFFAAAATVNRVFAYSGATIFMAELSAHLEVFNVTRARQIREGSLVGPASVERNTADFIDFEQTLLQRRLDALQRDNPALYASELRWAAYSLKRLADSSPPPASTAYGRLRLAFVGAQSQLGRWPQFEIQRDRVAIGVALARECMRP